MGSLLLNHSKTFYLKCRYFPHLWGNCEEKYLTKTGKYLLKLPFVGIILLDSITTKYRPKLPNPAIKFGFSNIISVLQKNISINLPISGIPTRHIS